MAHSLNARTSAPSASPISPAGWHAVEITAQNGAPRWAVARADDSGNLEYLQGCVGARLSFVTSAGAQRRADKLNAAQRPPVQLPEIAGREAEVLIHAAAGRWTVCGTREQLADLVPSDVAWPSPGQDGRPTWTDRGLQCGLKRVKPSGTKLLMKQWMLGDWWEVTCYLPLNCDARDVHNKARELAAAIRRQHQPPIRGSLTQARRDDRFQAMLAQVLPPAKDARRDETP